MTEHSKNWIRDHRIKQLGQVIFSIRWGLVPLYIGLYVAIIAYNVKFLQEVWFLVTHLVDMSQEDLLLMVLGLIDITMVANLIVMTTIGGYNIFVNEFDLTHLSHKPRWLHNIDSTSEKIKMGMSLIGVSAIHLLKTFMQAESIGWSQVLKESLIITIFVGITYGFAMIGEKMHKVHV